MNRGGVVWPQSDVGCMGRDSVGNAALLHVVALREAEVLLRRDIAEHAGAVVGSCRCADAAGDVVVAREDVGHERSEDVEGCSVAELPLELHVVLDLIEGHVSWSFDHDLNAVSPGALGELSERL